MTALDHRRTALTRPDPPRPARRADSARPRPSARGTGRARRRCWLGDRAAVPGRAQPRPAGPTTSTPRPSRPARESWKAFFFGSLDSSNFITVDKPPGVAVGDGAVRRGSSGSTRGACWSPQALEGVAAVALLYAAVRRWFGPAAGLLAGAVLALTPVAALMFRFNNPDALLVLLMTAAAYAMVRAIERGRTRWLVLAGRAARLRVPDQDAAGVPGRARLRPGLPGRRAARLRPRIWQLLAGLARVSSAAGWWVAAVELTPAAARPYVGGSTNNSILELTLGYNGLGRLTGSETGSVGGGRRQRRRRSLRRRDRADPAVRQRDGRPDLAGCSRPRCSRSRRWSGCHRRAPAHGRGRAACARSCGAAGCWSPALVFSFMAGHHPPVLHGGAGPGHRAPWPASAPCSCGGRARAGRPRRAGAGVAVTAGWSFVLLDRSPGWYPWLRWRRPGRSACSPRRPCCCAGSLAGRRARRPARGGDAGPRWPPLALVAAALAGPPPTASTPRPRPTPARCRRPGRR